MMSGETKAIVDRMREFGVRVGVLGRDVYVETASVAMFKTIARHYGADTDVVVCTVGSVRAADTARFEHAGYRFHIQGPARRPTAFDWARHRKAQEEGTL